MSVTTATPTTATSASGPAPRGADVDGRSLLDVSLLRSKAADLRQSAADISAPLSTTYRRRAAELELEAAALAARFGVIESLELAA